MKSRSIRRVGVAIVSLLIAASIGFCYLGYLSIDPFTTIRPARARSDAAAIVLSGDMGFRVGMAPQIASRLTAAGIPVVGVNSLTYFRTTRAPAEATALLNAAIGKAQAAFHPKKLILIGQSFGADMLHVALARLAPDLRRNIAMVALIVPGATVEFRASPSEIFTFTMKEEPALPTAKQIDWVPVLCVYGREESASLCPLLHQSDAHVVDLPGGHPLHYNATAVYRQLNDAMQRAGHYATSHS
ncbi:MAG: AcvB/VirJ family lysyl-phosphatidylglycerol hydrolase [Sphingobium sp.]|uniref:AcvB/VirJ family lysyl-phosphatidylglycerol hydrolase n=1 Tax=Sphingobium sp. TaxID=1912891 RepID=UPI0029ABF317|nr:AcvB/VirJ family lysyl-phosphatidylglycerol hydrolase [Sphingobium sp.]MDX3911402.1 AcvB/VirJ family lysyl-phosphatidylglycerol hydrolase [Sphingobium sp.]